MEDLKITPKSAYAAVLDDNGKILFDEQSLSNPKFRSIIFLSFESLSRMDLSEYKDDNISFKITDEFLGPFSKIIHHVVYHFDIDTFEFYELDILVNKGILYDIACGVIDYYNDSLFETSWRGRQKIKPPSKEEIADFLAWSTPDPEIVEILKKDLQKASIEELMKPSKIFIITEFRSKIKKEKS